MPSLAELFGFARVQGPWNSYPTQLDAPQAPQIPPADPWWLHGLIAPSSQAGLATFARPLDTASFESTPPNGGILGNFPALQGAPDALPSGGILQGLFPDAPRPSCGILGNLVPPPRGPNAAASGGIVPGAFPEAVPDANPSAGDRLGPAPFFLLGADSPGIFNSPTRAPFAPSSFPSWGDAATRAPQNLPDQEVSWPIPSLSIPTSPVSPDDPLNSMDVAFSPGADFRPGQFSRAGQIAAQPLNDAREAVTRARDAPLDTALDGQAGDSDASFARSYDRAQTTIASDEELRTTVRMAEKAGDEKFSDRLATIMANLEQNPKAAFDAIRSEIFNSQIRNRTSISAAAAVNALATWKAINRLDALQPKLGIWKAREAGFRPAVGLSQEQGGTIYRIAADESLSRDDRLHQMADAGLFDTALAAGLMGAAGLANRGGVLAPSDRPGGGPNRASTPDLPSRPAVEPKPPAVPNSDQVFVQSPKSDSPRNKAGIATGTGTKIEGAWLPGNTEAPVPAQVADLLRGRRFSRFDDLREAFWKAVASVPELASQFTTQNRVLMSRGRAPKAPRDLWAPGTEVYHLHHADRVADGGPVYHLDNVWVVSPVRHRQLYPKGSP